MNSKADTKTRGVFVVSQTTMMKCNLSIKMSLFLLKHSPPPSLYPFLNYQKEVAKTLKLKNKILRQRCWKDQHFPSNKNWCKSNTNSFNKISRKTTQAYWMIFVYILLGGF